MAPGEQTGSLRDSPCEGERAPSASKTAANGARRVRLLGSRNRMIVSGVKGTTTSLICDARVARGRTRSPDAGVGPRPPDRPRRRQRHLRVAPAPARRDRRRARRPRADRGPPAGEVPVAGDRRRSDAGPAPGDGRQDLGRRRGRGRLAVGPLRAGVRGRHPAGAARQAAARPSGARTGLQPRRTRRGRRRARGLPATDRTRAHRRQGAPAQPEGDLRRGQPARRPGPVAGADRARRDTGDLTEADLDRLRRELRSAIRSAVRLGGVHTGRFIRARRHEGVCPRDGHVLERATVGGRTTYWCPVCQK